MKTQRGFTLIEMLVTIAIMGLLAGLLFPGIQGAMRRAKQTRDTAAAKNLGLLLTTEAMDNDGYYRVGTNLSDTETTGTTRSVFQGLLDDGVAEDPRIFFAEGARQARSLTLTDENIGFQYVAGLTTTSPGSTPLLFTKGAGITVTNLNENNIPVAGSAWKKYGIVVACVGGHATFHGNRGRSETEIKLEVPIMLTPAPEGISIYE